MTKLDRAVVEDDICPQRTNVHASAGHQWSVPNERGYRTCLDCGKEQEPQPRWSICQLTDDERRQVARMAEVAAPVVEMDADGPNFNRFAVFRLNDVAEETIRQFGRARGRHLNSLGWRVARRFGWRVAAGRKGAG